MTVKIDSEKGIIIIYENSIHIHIYLSSWGS